MICGKRPTLKDVAKEAGVSGCLASKVLSGKEAGVWIAAGTKARILDAAQRLNYKPNIQARQLARGRKDAIGIFLEKSSDFSSSFVMTSIKGIVSRAEELGYTVNLGLSGVNADGKLKLVETGSIDSAILIPAREGFCKSLHETLKEEGIPAVFLNPGEWLDVNAVCCDDAGGMRQAVSYLKDLGHRRIAYIGQSTDHTSGQSRIKVFRALCPELGLEGLTLESGFNYPKEVLTKAVLEWKASALILYHDEMLIDLHMGCHALGLEMPEDLSVIAINDVADSKHFVPAPSCVRVPIFEMGMAAVDLLGKLIESGKPVPSALFAEELVVRGSCREIGK